MISIIRFARGIGSIPPRRTLVFAHTPLFSYFDTIATACKTARFTFFFRRATSYSIVFVSLNNFAFASHTAPTERGTDANDDDFAARLSRSHETRSGASSADE